MDDLVGIILAAGEGVRMKSRIPKVLHRLCGKELLRYPVELLGKLGVDRIVVVVVESFRGSRFNCQKTREAGGLLREV